MKASIYTITCGIAMAVLSLGSRNYSETLGEIKKAITESNEMYFQAFAKNDPSLFAQRFTEDCWIMLPNTPVMTGPDAPRDFFSIGYNQFGVRGGKRTTVDVYGISGDIVAEIGFWKLHDINNVEFEDGKYLVLWKKTSRGWRMWRDSFSSNRSRK